MHGSMNRVGSIETPSIVEQAVVVVPLVLDHAVDALRAVDRILRVSELLESVDRCFVVTRPRVAVLYGGAGFVVSPLCPPLTSLCVRV
ncbi:hypothetical protein F2Q68_00005010 [Brassica cretica]|uniref:Uncharacterized protein n=1 Tax=Brassica cretica TaxID=69181 RepID=A0A8S9JC54_BRACR|nr:hypothetical protein F2Q68_00005010 [Brassica cretica]